MSRSLAARARTLAAVALLGALVSCGVPQDGSMRTVAPDDVPYRLLEVGAGPTPEPTSDALAVTVPSVFFTDQEELLVAERQPVEASGVEPVVSSLLAHLAAGPTDEQRGEGLGSALGPDVGLRLVHVVEGVAYVEVTSSEQGPAADQLPLAIGQIVLTLASVEGVDATLLLKDQLPLAAPLPGGELTSRPLTPSDYTALVAPRSLPMEKTSPGPAGSPTGP
jgi:hypothetical protein